MPSGKQSAGRLIHGPHKRSGGYVTSVDAFVLVTGLGFTGYRIQTVIQNNAKPAHLAAPNKSDNGRHSIYSDPREGARSIRVETVTLDDFLEAEGWPRVDLIKIDVEGAEPAVIRGMERFLKRVETIKLIVELCPYTLRTAGVSPLEFLGALNNLRLAVRPMLDNLRAEHFDIVRWSRQTVRSNCDEHINLLCKR